MSEKVKTPNTQIQGTENAQRSIEEPLNSPNITVWGGFGLHSIIGPYYFDHPIVKGDNYLHMLRNFDLPTLHNYPGNTIFKQELAEEHFIQYVRQCLNEYLNGHWIGRGSSFPWSPDLTPCD